MEQINRIEVQGKIGNVRINSYNDNQVANFSVVTNYLYRNKEGDVIETTWHNVVAWEGKNMPDFEKLVKGATANVVGRLKSNKYTSADGIERVGFEIIANKISILDEY